VRRAESEWTTAHNALTEVEKRQRTNSEALPRPQGVEQAARAVM
jgi:hypothetical protein